MSDSKELITIIRPSFMKFCQDGCKAAAFNHILYWIARKSFAEKVPREKVGTGEITWYATTEEITEGMSNAWGVCKVRKEVNEIIDMGIIGRGKNPTWGADRTKHFFFGPDQCEKLLSLFQKHAICIDCLGLPSEVTQMINLSNANHKIIVCKCLKHQMEAIKSSDASDKSIEAITKVSTKVTSKDNNKGEERATSKQPTKPASVQSVFSLEEQKILDWYGKLGTGHETSVKKAKEILPELLQHIHSFEDMQSLYDFTVPRITGDDSTVYLANMARYIKLWEKNKPVVQPTIAELPVLTEQEATRLVLWTKTPGKIGNDIASFWTILKWMPESEARKYFYRQDGAFRAEEIEHYEQLSKKVAIAV